MGLIHDLPHSFGYGGGPALGGAVNATAGVATIYINANSPSTNAPGSLTGIQELPFDLASLTSEIAGLPSLLSPLIPFSLPQGLTGKPAVLPVKIDLIATIGGDISQCLGLLGNPTPMESLRGEGWELLVRRYDDYKTLLCVITDYTSFGFTKELNAVGGGTVTLDLDDPFWSRPMSTGVSPSMLLNYENLWEVYHQGDLKFDWLGSNVEETLVAPDETRGVEISGAGTGTVLKWAKVMPRGLPFGNPKTASITDDFVGDVLIRHLWNGSTPEVTVEPRDGVGKAKLLPAPPPDPANLGQWSFLAASDYDITDSYIQAKIEPFYPDPKAPLVTGSGIASMYIHVGTMPTEDIPHAENHILGDHYAQIKLDVYASHVMLACAVFDKEVSIGEADSHFRWIWLPTYKFETYTFWRVRHSSANPSGRNPTAKGTFHFGFSTDSVHWEEFSIGVDTTIKPRREDGIYQFKYFPWGQSPSAFDTTRVFVSFAAQLYGETLLTEPKVYVSDVNGTNTPAPLMKRFCDLMSEAKTRGTLDFITSLFTEDKDASGAVWEDFAASGSRIDISEGKDYLAILGEISAIIGLDWVMQPGFRLDVRKTDNFGMRLEDQIIYHEGGNQTLGKSRSRSREEIGNWVMGRDDLGNYQFQKDDTSIGIWRQRESYVTSGEASSSIALAHITAANLHLTKEEATSTTIQIGAEFDWVKPQPVFDQGNRAFFSSESGEFVEITDIAKAPLTFLLDSCDNLLSINQESIETNVNEWSNIVNCTLAKSSTQAISGSNSLRMTATANGDMSAIDLPSFRITVAASQALTASAWFRASTVGRSVRVKLQFKNDVGNVILTSTGTSVTDSNSGWVNAKLGVVVPISAVKVTIFLEVLSAGAGEIHYVDHIELLRPSTGAGAQSSLEIPNFEPVRFESFEGSLEDWEVSSGAGYLGNGTFAASQVTIDSSGFCKIVGDTLGNSGSLSWSGSRRYGAWEVRMRAPAGSNCYHPTLNLRAVGPFGERSLLAVPLYGGIKFAEAKDDATRQNVTATLYKPGDAATAAVTVARDMTSWHIYRLEWTPTFVAAYRDGIQYFYTEDSTYVPKFNVEMSLELNWFPGENATHETGSMEIDYVTEYKLEQALISAAGNPVLENYVPFIDYDVGDWVGIEEYNFEDQSLGISDFTIVPKRIMAISVGVSSDGKPTVELTIQSVFQIYLEKIKRQIDRLSLGLQAETPVASPIAMKRYSYDALVGDEKAFDYTVRHEMGTQAITVQIFLASSPYTLLNPQPTIFAIDNDSIKITFAPDPASNPPGAAPTKEQYRVVIKR